MASLNTLRTKFGVVLSVIIALALLAFILSLRDDMGFSGNDPKVGEIDGSKVAYSEYYDIYEQVREQSGAQESDEQQSALLANTAWQTLVARRVLAPGFEKAGLWVSEQERQAMIAGKEYSPVFYQAFADPRTGVYNVAVVSRFLAAAEANPQAMLTWKQLNEQARLERATRKFAALVRGGAFANSLEVASGVKAANDKFSGRWFGKQYASVPDSLIHISNSDIKAYYKKHKNAFRQLPSRTFSYVVFEVEPTDDDLLALEQTVQEVGAQFAGTSELKSFVRANRNGHIAENYVSAAQLTDEEAAALLAGKTYGPVLKNNEWTMARVLDSKVVPDSLGIRHIVLPYSEEELADSLLTVIRRGGNFAELAARYSVYDQTAANGGEVGVLPFSSFTGEFASALSGVKTGDVVKVASGDAVQLLQVYRAGRPVKHVQVASIVYPVEASAATVRDAHNQALSFTVSAKGSAEAFSEAASAAALTPRVATLTQGERTVRGLEDSRDVARWAYDADEGDLSEIFKVGKDYVVALLTDIDNDEYMPVKEVAPQIRAQLLRDKKFDAIRKELSGASLDEQAASLGAQVQDFSNVAYNVYYFDGAGTEPRLIGAIASATETGAISEPVKGFSGLYVFQVDNIEHGDAQSADDEKVRAQALAESRVAQLVFPAVQQLADIKDLRGKYF
ncbi:peptidylprolyl isomerase [uncultured Alistipes sp.]|jgi:peptidyl-prolyl cis-trans isomerase D|uniref:peptidylprolyl isomerase n=1 Tax=uncultured Alistipes sp. TaxID=538949 RepID=UPI002591F84F|nr:peptidylprolyl isomerase [uncultured Alistipes sp.]